MSSIDLHHSNRVVCRSLYCRIHTDVLSVVFFSVLGKSDDMFFFSPTITHRWKITSVPSRNCSNNTSYRKQ